MGDIADMMLEGTLCAGCGVFLEENHEFDAAGVAHPIIDGIPILCGDCK